MNGKSYMRNRFPIMKRNHEKIKVRLKPDTPMQSQILDVSKKYDIPESIDNDIEYNNSGVEQKVIYYSFIKLKWPANYMGGLFGEIILP
jgi:hypothetical protein